MGASADARRNLGAATLAASTSQGKHRHQHRKWLSEAVLASAAAGEMAVADMQLLTLRSWTANAHGDRRGKSARKGPPQNNCRFVSDQSACGWTAMPSVAQRRRTRARARPARSTTDEDPRKSLFEAGKGCLSCWSNGPERATPTVGFVVWSGAGGGTAGVVQAVTVRSCTQRPAERCVRPGKTRRCRPTPLTVVASRCKRERNDCCGPWRLWMAAVLAQDRVPD